MIPQDLRRLLEDTLGAPIHDRSISPVGGGSIHQAIQFSTGGQSYFLKFNHLREAANFAAEAHNLQVLGARSPLRVPKVHFRGETASHSFLLMEYIAPGRETTAYWQQLGRQLAQQHREMGPNFGWDSPNFIGRLPQQNEWKTEWWEFFITQRLQPMEQLGRQLGYLNAAHSKRFEKLYQNIAAIRLYCAPSLLHGDLWSGNRICDAEGQPVLVDPACYYGHHEVELAFTRLFGGFPSIFYEAYQAAYPLQAGWEDRVDLFNLYPLLAHLNMFGTGYRWEVESILAKYQ